MYLVGSMNWGTHVEASEYHNAHHRDPQKKPPSLGNPVGLSTELYNESQFPLEFPFSLQFDVRFSQIPI